MCGPGRVEHLQVASLIPVDGLHHPAIAHLTIGQSCSPLLGRRRCWRRLYFEPTCPSRHIRPEAGSETRSGLSEHSSRSAHARFISVHGQPSRGRESGHARAITSDMASNDSVHIISAYPDIWTRTTMHGGCTIHGPRAHAWLTALAYIGRVI